MFTKSRQREVITSLRQQLICCYGPGRPTFPCGLECILPEGLRRGTLIECLAEVGSGATALSLSVAEAACRRGGCRAGAVLVVIDADRQFYPPAATSLEVSNAIFIHPQSRKEELWALHQSLSCPGIGAVLAWPAKLDDRSFRSLQLAAERGGAVGLLIRPVSVRGQPSWSDLQLLVEPLPSGEQTRQMRIEVLRSRRGTARKSVVIRLDEESGVLYESHSLHLAAELATATALSVAAQI